MPRYTVDTTIGTTAGALFVDNTRAWSGGTTTFTTIDTTGNTSATATATDLFVGSGATVTGTDCNILASRIGNQNGSTDTGTIDLTNSTLSITTGGGAAHFLGGTHNISYLLDNTTILYPSTAYNFFGHFDTTASPPTYTWNNLTMSGDVDEAIAQVGLSIFSGNLNTASSFSGVSTWNGVALGSGARGGFWQTTTATIYNNSLIGPFGANLGGANIRQIQRFSNQGNNALTQANHTGLATNYDLRSLSQVNSTSVPTVANLQFALEVGTAGHIAFINWLPGSPTGASTYAFSSIFNSATNTGGQAHIFVASKPLLGGGEHRLTVSDAALTDGVLYHSGAWGYDSNGSSLTTSSGANVASVWEGSTTNVRSFTDQPDDARPAILFRNQHFNQATRTTLLNPAVANNIDDLTAKTYRKYSWLQQPDSATFGKLVTITPPVDGATDAQVLASRATGYDIFNGSTWETTTDITDPVDAITSQTAINTVAKATALFSGTTGIATSSHIVAARKLAAYNVVTDAGVDATNTVVPAGYTISGTVADFGTSNLDFEDSQLAAVFTANTLVAFTTDLTADNLISEVIADTITVMPDCLSGPATKVSLTATDTLTLPNFDLVNIALRGPTIRMTPRAGNEGLTIGANGEATLVNLRDVTSGQALVFDNIFGIGSEVVTGTLLTFASTVPITIGLPAGTNITLNSAIIGGVEINGSANVTLTVAPATVTTPLAGKLAFVNSTTNALVGSIIDVTAGLETPIPTGATFDIYYKPTNDLSTNTVYPLVSSSGATSVTPVSFAASAYPPILIGALDAGYLTEGSTTNFVRTAAFSAGVATFTYTGIPAALATLAQQEAKHLILDLTDTDEYIQAAGSALSAGTITAEPIDPAPNGVNINGAVVQLANAIRVVTLSNTIAPVSISPATTVTLPDGTTTVQVNLFRPVDPTDGISPSQVTQGATTAIELANLGTAATQVDALANDRLLGIRPNLHNTRIT